MTHAKRWISFLEPLLELIILTAYKLRHFCNRSGASSVWGNILSLTNLQIIWEPELILAWRLKSGAKKRARLAVSPCFQWFLRNKAIPWLSLRIYTCPVKTRVLPQCHASQSYHTIKWPALSHPLKLYLKTASPKQTNQASICVYRT